MADCADVLKECLFDLGHGSGKQVAGALAPLSELSMDQIERELTGLRTDRRAQARFNLHCALVGMFAPVREALEQHAPASDVGEPISEAAKYLGGASGLVELTVRASQDGRFSRQERAAIEAAARQCMEGLERLLDSVTLCREEG